MPSPYAPEWRDSRGRTISVGDVVALNVSGIVTRAKVTRLKARGGYTSHSLEAALLEPAAGQPPGHISKVKHAYTVMVLRPCDHVG